MNEKINPGASTGTSRSEGKTKYVLEDVFWVPVSNWALDTLLSLTALSFTPKNPTSANCRAWMSPKPGRQAPLLRSFNDLRF